MPADSTCPTCGEPFDTERGMKCHHKRAHGESLAGEEYECDWCGETFRRMPSLAEKSERNFCDDECMGKASSEWMSGENHWAWVGDDALCDCDWCGEEFRRKPAELEKGEHNFCSKECTNAWRSEYMSGENSPSWKGGPIEVQCEWCGDAVEVQRSKAQDEDRRNFCSIRCRSDWFSENMSGENSPEWKGGFSDEYGPNWEEQREKALERDGRRCQGCGIDESEHYRGLSVHHIRPLDGFDSCEEANRLPNLVSLCDSCHIRWEGIPVAPSLDD